MAREPRKFYYDWHDGKYKLNQENGFPEVKMSRKPNEADINGDSLWSNERKDYEAKKFHEALDSVDSGRFTGIGRKSKPVQSIDEISKGHKTMVSILSTRLLRLNAAQTLWHKDLNRFIEYILRLDDDAVLVDLLPILTKRVRNDGPECPSLSMGACLDLLPILGKLVQSKFEDYIIASMDMIREIMKRWWKELQAAGKKEKEDFNANFRSSRSVGGVYMIIISMTDRIQVLSKRSGKVGEKAKVLHELMGLI